MSKKKSAKKKTTDKEISPEMQVSKGVEKKHLEEFDVTDGKDRTEKEKQIENVKELGGITRNASNESLWDFA